MDNQNLIRELQKIEDVLNTANRYFVHKDQMNASLHMSETVRATPLASAVSTAFENLVWLVSHLEEEERDEISP